MGRAKEPWLYQGFRKTEQEVARQIHRARQYKRLLGIRSKCRHGKRQAPRMSMSGTNCAPKSAVRSSPPGIHFQAYKRVHAHSTPLVGTLLPPQTEFLGFLLGRPVNGPTNHIRLSLQHQTAITRKHRTFNMTAVVKMSAFPIASEILNSLPTRASRTSLSIPRATKSSAPWEMIGILVSFVAGLYVAVQIYGGALCLLDSQLPKAFSFWFCAAYLFQMFVGYLEHKEEQTWRETTKKQ
ncbi:hypothetical protein BU23DRAFT_565766 [Bimuria novae-zelandiae CBS 107.79]|uniref:Uncharacterized protein n=1 Tax=Bimuria novae-zelandiae CBS 107.79 TaxID=1447943 RepID=A0A6A5VIX5_9PLEO|nr:hypothetical protein BU23DRAFT_565766 [Bimuria novae-zelandiae CBS 107.79]